MGSIQCAVPILPVRHMDESVAFYRDKLGFEVAWIWEDNGYAAVRCGDTELHLDVQESFATYRAHSYFFVQDADETYRQYKNNGVEIVNDLLSKPWGVKEFTFRDPNGHSFRVAQP